MSRHALLAATALAGALLPSVLAAAEIEARSRVESVTVHPDTASVVRVATVTLPAGSHTVMLRGLASAIDPASVRVEGEGTARFAIGSVDVRAVPGDARAAADPALEARIDGLRREREGLMGRVAALDGKKKAIEGFAEGAGSGGNGRPGLPLDQWSAAWDAIGQGLEATHAAIAAVHARIEILDREIAALEKARPGSRDGAPRHDVTIALEAPAAAEATLRVSYRVSGARWSPAYDLRLDTGGKDRKPALELVRRAQVSQLTGEDWTDAALTVSTVRAARGTQAPEVPDLTVSLVDPIEIARRAEAAAAAQRRAAQVSAAPMMARAVPAAPVAVAADEQGAEIDTSGFQAAFRIAGRVTLPADGTLRTYALTTRRIEPALVVRTAPLLDETAYLEASFTHDEEAPLLAGPASLHRDGVYVGRGRIAQTAPGEKLDLGFGADDRVKVSRVPLRRQAAEPGWIGNTRSEVRAFKTTVRNLHDVPLKVVVVDQMPVAENTAVTVDTLQGMTPPTEKGIKDRRGVVAWTLEMKPGDQRDILHGYKLAWPADRELTFGGPQALRR